MRIVVGGCRDFEDYQVVKQFLDEVLGEYPGEPFLFLSGHCKGVDMLSERYAEENGHEVEQHPVQWDGTAGRRGHGATGKW